MNTERELAAAVRAARVAGAIVRGGISMDKHTQFKANDRDPVTIFDKYSEQAIVEILHAEFPDYGVLSEEGLDSAGAAPCRWVIDPLDGTNNYVRRVPQFAVSIGLECDGEAEAGCIYDPMRDELFTARCDVGAWCNGTPLRVSETTMFKDVLVAVEFSSYPDRARTLYDKIRPLIDRVRGVRAYGSACLDLAYVAAGWVDAAVFLSLSPWDVAAGIPLIIAAGGTVTDLDGNPLVDPRGGLIATNGALHAELLALLNEC